MYQITPEPGIDCKKPQEIPDFIVLDFNQWNKLAKTIKMINI